MVYCTDGTHEPSRPRGAKVLAQHGPGGREVHSAQQQAAGARGSAGTSCSGPSASPALRDPHSRGRGASPSLKGSLATEPLTFLPALNFLAYFDEAKRPVGS